MAGLLAAVVGASEKAAHVARLCRQEQPLFQLLVAEKTGSDRNRRFLRDFKTLADVLIQEVIKHDLGEQVGDKAAGGGGVGRGVPKVPPSHPAAPRLSWPRVPPPSSPSCGATSTARSPTSSATGRVSAGVSPPPLSPRRAATPRPRG